MAAQWQCTARVTSLRADIGLISGPHIAVTGHEHEHERLSAQAAGFAHHFATPIEFQKLVALLIQF